MKEFLLVLGSTLAVAGALALVATWLEPVLRFVENALTFLSTALIIFVMCYVCAEVVMRYGFDSPIQGHLEGSELFVPMIVFFAISYTQARNGHVGMTLVVDVLPKRWQRILEMSTLTLSMLICALLAYFGYKYAHQLWEYDDVTMTPPYWRTWPSAAAITLGYGMLAVRMWLQVLHMYRPDRFPASPTEEISELHMAD